MAINTGNGRGDGGHAEYIWICIVQKLRGGVVVVYGYRVTLHFIDFDLGDPRSFPWSCPISTCPGQAKLDRQQNIQIQAASGSVTPDPDVLRGYGQKGRLWHCWLRPRLCWLRTRLIGYLAHSLIMHWFINHYECSATSPLMYVFVQCLAKKGEREVMTSASGPATSCWLWPRLCW